MLTIRFNRTGKKNRASFRVVLQEHTVAPGGRHVEMLGSYDPHSKKAVLKAERINYWIGKGAQISDSVYNLLIKQGIIKGKKRAIKIKRTEKTQKETELTQKKAEVVLKEEVNNEEVEAKETKEIKENKEIKESKETVETKKESE